MNISIINEQDQQTVALNGMLDSASAPSFQEAAEKVLQGSTPNVVLDLSDLTYTSSQGLRIILTLQRNIMAKGGSLVIKGVQPTVKEVFDMTGFSSILNIQ